MNSGKPLNSWKLFFHYLFGSYNGIQVFLFPSLLVTWLETEYFVETIAGLFGMGLHFFPLFIFLLAGFFVLFIVLKNWFIYHSASSSTLSESASVIIGYHKLLLIALICYALLYVLAMFLKYFYGIKLPTTDIAALSARVLGIVSILYYYLINLWTLPWHKRGYSQKGARRRMLAFARLHPYSFWRFNLVQLFMVYLTSRVYINFTDYIYRPLFSYLGHKTGFYLSLKTLPLSSSFSLLINVIIIVAAFVISNFLFIPLVWLTKLSTATIHPVRSPRTQPQYTEGTDI